MRTGLKVAISISLISILTVCMKMGLVRSPQIKPHLLPKVAAALTVILQKKSMSPLPSACIQPGKVRKSIGYVIESFVRVRGCLLYLICVSFHAPSRCRALGSPRRISEANI